MTTLKCKPFHIASAILVLLVVYRLKLSSPDQTFSTVSVHKESPLIVVGSTRRTQATLQSNL